MVESANVIGNAVGFGFFGGHDKKLAFDACTEKYLFKLYFNSGN